MLVTKGDIPINLQKPECPLFCALIVAVLVSCGCSEGPAPLPEPEQPLSEIPESRRLEAVGPVAEEMRHVDPRLDGWDTEAFNEAAGGKLKKLLKLLDQRDRLSVAAVEPFVVEGFRTDLLRPAKLEELYSKGGWTVHAGGSGAESLAGAAGLKQSLGAAAEPFGQGPISFKTKIVSVTASAQDRFEARVLGQLWGDARDGGSLQQNAVWETRWQWPDEAHPPRLESIRLASYRENRIDHRPFSDCTEAVLGDQPAYREQLLRGTDDWCARIGIAARMNQYGHNGVAVGDIDNDGLEDVYLLQSGGLPNRLFRQNADGSATDVSAAAGVDWLNESRGALFLDLDNDGAQDLVLATTRGTLVMRGDGAGRFELETSLPATEGYSLAAADVDGDRLLDLYVCNYLQTAGGSNLPSPYHDAQNGPPNVLFRNAGGFRFEDVTEAVGLDDNNNRFSYAASWVDYDDDGDLDLYVANDFGRNNLYRNDGGRFRDVAGEAGVEDMAAGMGTSWADYDADGDLDLYVSNMFSSAGGRIAYQRRFTPATEEDLAGFQRHARGNSLFANNGDGTFRDVTEEAGVTMGRWAWGAEFVDLNGDDLEDIYIPNGFITNEDTKDL
jgi:hypothetical protein